MSYSVDSDLWMAADAFSFTAFAPDKEIVAGMEVVYGSTTKKKWSVSSIKLNRRSRKKVKLFQ